MAILMYHHIGTCPPEQEKEHRGLWVREEIFAAHMSWLREHGWTTVTLDAVGAHLAGTARLPKRWVTVTFDDGWRDNFTRAMPVLSRFGQIATVFLVTGKIRNGQATGSWDEYLSPEEIAEMAASGVRFESHTRSHSRLTRLSEAEVRNELGGSRDDLADLTGIPPSWLAYPYGAFSREVARWAGECGYTGAVATIRDNRVRPSQMFWLPRVMVMETTTPEHLSYMLSWRYHVVHVLKNRRRWKDIR